MRHALRLALALTAVLLISAPASRAADGIKASATASRDVPADLLAVTFTVSDRIVPGEIGGDRRETLAKALEEKGLRVLERTARYLPMMTAYGAGQLSATSGALRDTIEVRRQVTFRLGGFKRIDDVIDAFARQGIRQVNLAPYHSRAEAVRQELRREAIETAIAQARRLAAQAGVRTGGVIDLATQPQQTVSGVFMHHTAVVPGLATDQNLIDPRQPGSLPLLRITVTASVVLAIKGE
jgi:uncharacterized protein YggE